MKHSEIYETFSITIEIFQMYFSIQRFKENKSNSCFIKIVKILYHNDPPPITAPANKGQNLQVPSRPLSRGYTVLIFFLCPNELLYDHRIALPLSA